MAIFVPEYAFGKGKRAQGLKPMWKPAEAG